MNQAKKLSVAIAASVALIIGIYKWYQPTGNIGVYGNKVSTYITTKEGRQKEADWLKANGYTSYEPYGIADYIISHPDWVADLFLRIRKNGITKQIAFPYSSIGQVTFDMDKYNKKQTNDSCKFSAVVMEYEQYQKDMSRTVFYVMLRDVDSYCEKNKLMNIVYQGWLNQQDADSLVKYADRIYLHAYGRYDLQSNVGRWVYSYQRSRLEYLATAMNKRYPNDLTKKLSVANLASNENPVAINPKTGKPNEQFGYIYFKTHTIKDWQKSIIDYWNTTYVPAWIKARIDNNNVELFVENFAK